MMHTLKILPESPLRPAGDITAQFTTAGVIDFRQAAAYLNLTESD